MKSGRWPLILLGAFAVACLVALVLLGDLARYQEPTMVDDSRTALRDVGDADALAKALARYPANRILKLVSLAEGKYVEMDMAARRLLGEAAPVGLARVANLAASNPIELEALRRDLKAAEIKVVGLSQRIDLMIKGRRDELQAGARPFNLEASTVARFMTAVDEGDAEWKALVLKVLAAHAEYYAAQEKCVALLVGESGAYKVTNGQVIFRLQPTADSYNAASAAMADAARRTADLEAERGALRQSQLARWKKFVSG